ncbi:helix-turn-helix transcriptional regulator [Kitasatospora sp. NBC_01246]|uniref:helix-turn-helix transcriptional regulator n=1 Tax=Kitasatospora sp. NBC_01246 TaxID=2903570 RepID=UPI002E341019|nr:helix-turn-helix transcriptional regulator [Kitasatospora sp. NBC_01246]
MSARTAPKKLTAQQAAVLDRVGAGMSNREISAALALGPDTVKRYLAQAFVRLDAQGRVHAFARAWQSGQLPHTQPVTGPPILTGEQTLILRIWAAGGSRPHTARALRVSKTTAGRREQDVLDALGTAHRVVAVRIALEHQLIDQDDESLSVLCTTPMAADPGQGRTHPLQEEESSDAEPAARPVAHSPNGPGPAGRFEEALRSVAGVIVHLGALAGLGTAPTLADILLGTAPRNRTPTVVRLVHRALALGVPCALVIPPGATDVVKNVTAAGLACAWSGAIRQGTPNPAAAYAAAAHELGALPDQCLVVCTGDQAPVAAAVGPRQVLTTATAAARTVPRRSPLPAITTRERQIAELAARGHSADQIGERLAVGEQLVRSELAALRHRFAVTDDTELVARLITAELIDTRHLRAELPARAPDLDQAERAVLALMCAGALDPGGVRAVGLTQREARAAEARAIQALSPRRSRTHAVAAALITGAVAPPLPPPASDPEPAISPAAPRRRPRLSPSRPSAGHSAPRRRCPAAEDEHAPAAR